MRFSLSCLALLLLVACSSPVPPPPTSAALIPTAQPTATQSPTVAPTATPQVIISLITPTTQPTQSLPSGAATAPAASTAPTTLPSLGTAEADAALVAILQRCWQVSDPRELNGTLETHRNAFDCARTALTSLAQANPTYALVHRLLAWGYYYKDNNVQASIAEYRTSAQLYHAAGDRGGESEARLRLALLLMPSSAAQGCNELGAAATVYPDNTRALEYFKAYNCKSASIGNTAGGNTGGQVTAVPTAVNLTLDQVRGRILFQSDRGSDRYYMMEADGRNVQPVTQSLYDAAARWESFSPDHQQVAVVRYEGFNSKFGYNNDIWVTDPSGGNGRALANPANDYDPVWSPQGLFDGLNWLAFVSNRGDISHSDKQGEEIWIMHPDGTGTLRLTCHGPSFSKHPSWSPDATRLVYFSSFTGGNSQLYVMDLSTLRQQADPCSVGQASKNLSNNAFNDSVPIWVK